MIAQQSKQRLVSLLNTTPDGWLHQWEAMKVSHKEAFDEFAESADDQVMSEEFLVTIWPFDVK